MKTITPVKGAHWHKGTNKWVASVRIKGRTIYVGSYESQKSAGIARDAVARFVERHSQN